MIGTEPLKRFAGTRKSHDRSVQTVCQECSVGCGLVTYVKNDRIVDVQGDEFHPINRGRLCARGIAFVQGLTADQRITLPGTRNRLNKPFEAFDNLDKGIDLLAERLRRVKEQHGAESLVIGCDPQAGLDFYLGAQRFARLWGTPHVYHPLQESQETVLPVQLRHPTIYSTQWSNSGCLVLIEADMAATHPVAFQRVQEAQRGGTKVIAADSRYTTTMSKADTAVLIDPNRGNDLGLALMKIFLEEQFVDSDAISSTSKEIETWMETYAALPMENLAAAIGLDSEKIRAIARALSRCKPVTLITSKRLAFASHYDIWLTMARVMQWHAGVGGGWYPLESGAPVLDSTAGLEEVEPMDPPGKGIGPAGMDPMAIKALIGTGNCLADFLAPLHDRVNDLDLTVYFGSFPNRTRQSAHMCFPASAWPERESICFSDDGVLQWSRRVINPNDACRTGIGFWMRLAKRFGWEEHFPWKKANDLVDLRAFYQWLFKSNSLTKGLKMNQLDQVNTLVYWRRDADEASRLDSPLYPAPGVVAARSQAADPVAYPFGFQTTRTAARSNDAGRWSSWTSELEDDMGVSIHPRIAQTLGIENGEAIFLTSEDETMEAIAAITRSVPPWLVWSPRPMKGQHVLVYRKGQAPEEARNRLKGIET